VRKLICASAGTGDRIAGFGRSAARRVALRIGGRLLRLTIAGEVKLGRSEREKPTFACSNWTLTGLSTFLPAGVFSMITSRSGIGRINALFRRKEST